MTLATVQDFQEGIDRLVRWSPQFERGYQWNAFYLENAVPPVLCYGTRSTRAMQMRDEGITPTARGSTVLKLYEQLSNLVLTLASRYDYGTEFVDDEPVSRLLLVDGTLLGHHAARLYDDSKRLYFTFSPGIAWCYANMGGENMRKVSWLADKVIANMRNVKLSDRDESSVTELEAAVAGLERQRLAGTPAIALIHTPLDKFSRTDSLAFFFNEQYFNERLAPEAPDKAMRACAEYRHLTPDHRFEVALVDDEIYTTERIPAKDIVDILIADHQEAAC